MISKREFSSFLRKEILPRFGEEWRLWHGEIILRVAGVLVQGVSFSRWMYGSGFDVTYFLEVLAKAEPSDTFSSTLGDRLHDASGRQWSSTWPPETPTVCVEVLAHLDKQMEPRRDHPLTVATVEKPVEHNTRRIRHFDALWSWAIILGLQDQFTSAREAIEQALGDLEEQRQGWEQQGKAPPTYLRVHAEHLESLREHLTDRSRFAPYCEQVAAKRRSSLNLA